MKRIIKFRGICNEPHNSLEGQFVFGSDLVQCHDGRFRIGCHCLAWQFVDPKSLAQLIGVDKNGNEVYEGDIVIRIAGEDFVPEKTFHMSATFDDFFAINNGEIVLEV